MTTLELARQEDSVEADYLMITSIEMKNFRCFREVKQTSLKRFTFVVGKSGTGKTALLEALFLGGGANAEIYFRIRRWRGFGDFIEMAGTKDSYESLFRDLFYNFDSSNGIYIRLDDSNKGTRKLEINYEGGGTIDLPFKDSVGQTGDAFTVVPITFKWDLPKKVVRSQVEIKDGVLRMTGGTQDVFPIIFVSPQTMNSRQNALKYSELSKRNATAPVVDALKEAFPEVIDLSLEAVSGDLMLHVSMDGLPEKIPLVVLSGGMNKYLSIVLAILATPGGCVIVDEIENGFYYENLPRLLRTLVDLCQKDKTQLIASTHSYEFLQSVASIMDEKLEKDVALLRLDKPRILEQPTLTMIPGSNYKAAIESGFEVR